MRCHFGITDFVLCLGYKGDMIKDYFLHYEAQNCDLTVTLGAGSAVEIHGSRIEEEGWRVTLVDTGEESMTGARIKWASRYLDPGDRTFCVTYGDGLIDMDLGKTLAFHESHAGIATVTEVRPPSRHGHLPGLAPARSAVDGRWRSMEGVGVTEPVGALHGGIARYNGCRTVKFTTTPFDSIWLIDPEAHEDERGFFARTWCRRELERYGLKSCRCTT